MVKSIVSSIKAILLILLLICGLAFCSNPTQKSNEAKLDESVQVEIQPLLNSKIEYLLPSPDEIIGIIAGKDIQYSPSLVLDYKLDPRIINSDIQALILGVYISDFSYSLLYNDYIRNSKYIETIKEFSDKVGVGGVFNENFFYRLTNSMNSIDSLRAIYLDFSKKSFNSLSESSSKESLSLIAMGASIESIYLGYQILKDKAFDKSLKPFLIQQRMFFDNFYQIYSSFNIHKKNLSHFNNDIETFNTNFKLNIWLVVDKNRVSKSDSTTSLEVKYTVKTNIESINSLGVDIVKIREKLVNLDYQE